MGFSGFRWMDEVVLLGFTGFYWVLPSFFFKVWQVVFWLIDQ